ncbi:MAG: hypothetical protein HWN51_05890 [Desulfobacterales bacterium]|nr:hypothetical protein [Desulfobacterales bacterium]
MGGKRLGSFRAGDRSEYLAAYSLSRFAFVNMVPRQEDFGVVDFLCVLTKEEQRCVYPESAFYVQVKSTEDDVPFTEDAVRWISDHMDHPLFVCVVDKNANHLKIYSLTVRLFFSAYCEFLPHFVAEYDLILAQIWVTVPHQRPICWK